MCDAETVRGIARSSRGVGEGVEGDDPSRFDEVEGSAVEGVLESGVAEEHETVVSEAGHAGEAALDSLERAGALGGTGGELHHALARGGIVEATHGGAAARGGDANRESGTRSRDGETVRRAVARERGRRRRARRGARRRTRTPSRRREADEGPERDPRRARARG